MKKNLLYVLFLLVSGIANAQIVNIPDVNFKSFLIEAIDLFDGHPIDANGDGEIQVSEAEEVNTLIITDIYNHAPITNIQGIEFFTNVEVLNIMISQTPDIDLSALTNLESLSIEDERLVNLNIQGLINLETFNLVKSGIISLDLSLSQNLSHIGIAIAYNDDLTSLIIGNNTQLENISVNSTGLESLDLSGCPNIESFSFNFGGSHDVFLNLKNGNINFSSSFGASAYFDNNQGNKCYICIDEGEEFENVSDNVVFGSYCTFKPGGDYNTITGSINYDQFNNGCASGNLSIPLAVVRINDGTTTGYSYNTDGIYNFFTQAGTFNLTPQFENDWFTVTPATINFADNNNNESIHNFCVTSNGIHHDVEVAIIPVLGARPGFDATYKIVYKNKGNQTLSGDVVFTYNDDVLDYVSASATPATGSLTWSYTDLLPFETREVTVILNVNGPMETPAVNIGDVLTFVAAVTPATGDETTEDNSFNYKQDVVGSFDPNDITCLEGATVNPDKIGEYLHYNINFENTGTAAATFIVVKDIIDAAKFDVNTLQILDASHAMETRVTGNKVEFIFDDINLGAAEKGNVTFKIKTLNTLAVNSEVTQQADIFFDYNWPIQTNEATTTFAILSVGSFKQDSSVKVYPNPANGMVTISPKAEITWVQLYDVQGRLLQSGSGNTIDVSNRQAGIYFVKVMTDKGMKVEKLVRK
ncbi:hypothetical protein Q765_19765 [Flavobacterium rivuli WB 3.3-2 = DSM 21788]|uniref:Uncharacterized protein n=1 Tax=Flavobacterium rivuli WB 3.3-2 = DSM 21788 TaxID=1121895 RepID=A0A0A2M920_9FLAO|nr:T9SS type A sorting domain-containing protein [Flavobacterium rivuli]KGO84790.1 hypothetical protein Q765_19765 [Flavobacterium rivuli WB 3.3-2 = DSM 21788]